MNSYSKNVNKMMPKNSYRIMEFLLRRPGRQYNVNQISRKLEISVGSAHKILSELSGRGIIKAVSMGNAIFNQLNLSNSEAKKMCELIFIESRNRVLDRNPAARIYAEEIQKFKPAKALILFGSILEKGENAKDVDVLFVIDSTADIKKVDSFTIEMSKIKSKPVVPLIMTEDDLRTKIRGKEEVTQNIITTGVVLGGEDTVVKCME